MVARALSAVVAVVAAVSSFAGLLTDGVYRGEPSVVAGLRGGDLVTLGVGLCLAATLWWLRTGSRRAHLVWLGLLGYLVYAYAYYVFTAAFNDLFLAHVAGFVGSAVALLLALVGADAEELARGFSSRTPVRTVAAMLILVAVALVWTWGSASLRFALTGEAPTDVLPYPEWRVHLGYALDLTMIVPAALTSGVLLWRRRPFGYVTSTAVAVALAMYQVNYAVTQVFLAEAGVPGVSATDPAPFVACAIFAAVALAMLTSAGGRTASQKAHSARGTLVDREPIT